MKRKQYISRNEVASSCTDKELWVSVAEKTNRNVENMAL